MFLRGMVPMPGFRTSKACFKRVEQPAHPMGAGRVCDRGGSQGRCRGRLGLDDDAHMAAGVLQPMALGLIGVFAGKVYMQTRRQPKFILGAHL